jgi:hypothetical protein
METSTHHAGDEVGECPVEIAIGCHVEVELIDETGGAELLAIDLAPEGKGDLAAGFVAANTPLAKAVLGRRAGETVDYHVGDIVQVRILRVEAGRGPAPDAEANRQAVLEQAVNKSDLADAVRFSLTVDQKWGDTDPQVMADNWEK